MTIDFKGLAAELLSQSRSLVPQWLPGGKVRGNEYVCGSVEGGPGDSCSVNLETGLWADFSTDQKGGDLISLYAEIHGISQKDAFESLGGKVPKPQKPRRKKKLDPLHEKLKHHRHGVPSDAWTYRDADGNDVAYVARYDTGKNKKTFLPWVIENGKPVSKGLPKPRPLYQLDKLTKFPDRPVMVVEGEKAADAAQKIVGDRYVVTTFMNGSNGAPHCDWTPVHGRRVVTVWPDADESGLKAGAWVAAELMDKVGSIKVIDSLGQESGWDAADALDEGWDWDKFLQWARAHACEPTKEMPDDGALDRENLTDLGNAMRLVRVAGHEIRYVGQWGRWLVWDGMRWKLDTGMAIQYKFDDVLSDIDDEIEVLEDAPVEYKVALSSRRNGHLEDLPDWRMKSESRSRIEAAISLARSRPQVGIAFEDLDNQPWSLNVQNGTIDLTTGKLRPHKQSDLLTQVCTVPYEPDAECPRFLKFLREIMPNQPMVEYLQRVFGYALTGSVREDKLWICWGSGANGKSTLASAIRNVLGKDYSGSLPPDLLMESRQEKHATGLADMYRRRAVWADETSEGRRLDEGLVKRLTGGDTIKARRMREDFWEFNPTHKLFLSTNHKPEIRGTDPAIWRRVNLIPFDVTIPREHMDLDLDDKLQSEASGILAWMVRGCLEWQKIGLQEPDEVMVATQQYQEESDPVEEFLEDCCVTIANAQVLASVLYQNFREWYEENQGRKAMSGTMFGRRIGQKFKKKKTAKGNVYQGLGLKQEDYTWV
jgi:putative DNA primase/helicase